MCLLVGPVQAEPRCPLIQLHGDLDPGLDDVEKGLVCGEAGGAWAKIPFWQARYNLRNFLQKRGYLHPQFIQIHEGNGRERMRVDVGPKSTVTRITVEGEQAGVRISRLRQIIGQPLSPSSLNTIERWITEKLKNRGYACPSVTSQADTTTGEVKVQIESGPLQNFASVTTEPISGLAEGVLRRYDAFHLGDVFNESLLTVTTQRVSSSGIVENSHFRSSCQPDGVHLFQEVIPGRPRLLILGAGINTEGVLLGKFVWRNTRLGQFGSLLDLSASASARLQTLQGAMNWYFLPKERRVFLAPLAQVNHDNEQYYQVVSFINQIGVASTLDSASIGVAWFLGPSLNFYRTLSGVGAPEAAFLFLENRISLKSHSYEFFSQQSARGVQF